MKRTLAFLFATLLATQSGAAVAPAVEPHAESTVADGAGGTVYDRVYSKLSAFDQRRVGSAELDASFAAIEAELRAAGLEPRYETFDSIVQTTERLDVSYGGAPVKALMIDNGAAAFVTDGPIEGPAIFVGDGSVAATWGFMFSLVFSAVRADVARQFRFNPAFQYSEDIDWALRIRESGLKIVYAADAAVTHSHNYTPEILRKRFYNEGIANGMLFRKRPSFVRAVLGFAVESLRDFRYLLSHHELGYYFFAGIRYRWTQRMSCYKGEEYAWKQDFFHKKESSVPLMPKK